MAIRRGFRRLIYIYYSEYNSSEYTKLDYNLFTFDFNHR